MSLQTLILYLGPNYKFEVSSKLLSDVFSFKFCGSSFHIFGSNIKKLLGMVFKFMQIKQIYQNNFTKWCLCSYVLWKFVPYFWT